jgi:hypothetical protein
VNPGPPEYQPTTARLYVVSSCNVIFFNGKQFKTDSSGSTLMWIVVFWVMTPCSPAGCLPTFRRTFRILDDGCDTYLRNVSYETKRLHCPEVHNPHYHSRNCLNMIDIMLMCVYFALMVQTCQYGRVTRFLE